MANYQSRYTGPEIDERLRKAGEAVLTEAQSLDAGKQAQARENIGAASSAALEGKVDKVAGKGLSTNDYTNQDKQVVDAVPGDIAGIRGALDTLGDVVATKYTKPSTGIPASDIAEGVIPDVSNFITKSVDDLTNYYLKTETYTKDEVAALIGAIQQFHYEIYPSTNAVQNPQPNVLYLIGPKGSGTDMYEEYVFTVDWVKIGDTSIDLSGYVTTTALNTALAAYTTSADLATLLAAKQDTISDLADIRSGSQNNIKYAAQTLTDAQKAQARSNIGAGTYSRPSSGIPASDLAEGVIPDVSQFVTKSVNDLANYYLKTETYTKDEVQQLISTIQGFSYEVVATLPAASADTMGKIYLVPSSDPQSQNVKDEYITIDNGASAQTRYTWEQIGSTAVDLSGYVTTQQLNTALAAKQDVISDLASIRSGATAGATAYQKPQGGIPASDIAPGVIPEVESLTTAEIDTIWDNAI